jgi:hypothetical protein
LLTIVAENPQGARTIREQRPRAQKGGEGISATTENIEASIQERRPQNMPALIGRGPVNAAWEWCHLALAFRRRVYRRGAAVPTNPAGQPNSGWTS